MNKFELNTKCLELFLEETPLESKHFKGIFFAYGKHCNYFLYTPNTLYILIGV